MKLTFGENEQWNWPLAPIQTGPHSCSRWNCIRNSLVLYWTYWRISLLCILGPHRKAKAQDNRLQLLQALEAQGPQMLLYQMQNLYLWMFQLAGDRRLSNKVSLDKRKFSLRFSLRVGKDMVILRIFPIGMYKELPVLKTSIFAASYNWFVAAFRLISNLWIQPSWWLSSFMGRLPLVCGQNQLGPLAVAGWTWINCCYMWIHL